MILNIYDFVLWFLFVVLHNVIFLHLLAFAELVFLVLLILFLIHIYEEIKKLLMKLKINFFLEIAIAVMSLILILIFRLRYLFFIMVKPFLPDEGLSFKKFFQMMINFLFFIRFCCLKFTNLWIVYQHIARDLLVEIYLLEFDLAPVFKISFDILMR